MAKQIIDVGVEKATLDGTEMVEMQEAAGGIGSSKHFKLSTLATYIKSAIASFFATTAQGAKADSAVQSVVAGANVAVDNTDPQNPVVSSASAVQSVVSGVSISVDNTDPLNPVVSSNAVQSIVAGDNVSVDNTDPLNPIVSGSGGTIQSLVAGSNITIDATDPANPIISSTGGGSGGGGTLQFISEVKILDNATQSVDFTGLNLQEDGIYVLEYSAKLAGSASTSKSLSLYFNNDSTDINYYSQILLANDSGLAAARVNKSSLAAVDPGSSGITTGTVTVKSNQNFPIATNVYTRNSGSSIQCSQNAVTRNVAENVTTISVVASTTFSTGDYVRLYKLGTASSSGGSSPTGYLHAYSSVDITTDNTNAVKKVVLDTVDVDTAGLWDATNSRVNIAKAGVYAVTFQRSANTAAFAEPTIKVNGVQRSLPTNAGSQIYDSTVALLSLEVGDYIEPFVYNPSSTTFTVQASGGLTVIGPIVNGSSGSNSNPFIGASARNVDTVPATNVSTQVPLPVEDFDTSAIFDPATSKFTVPTGMSGYWRVTFSAVRNSGTGTLFLFLRKNGVGNDSFNLLGAAAGGQTTNYAYKSIVIQLVENDYLTLTVFSDGGGNIGISSDANQATIMQMEYLGPSA